MLPPHKLVPVRYVTTGPDVWALVQVSLAVTIIVAFLLLIGILIGYLAWGNRQN